MAKPNTPEMRRRDEANRAAKQLPQLTAGADRDRLYQTLLSLVRPDVMAGIFSTGVAAQDIDSVHADASMAIWVERTSPEPRWPRSPNAVSLFEGSFSAYVRGMARNLAREHNRKIQRRWRENLTPEPVELAAAADQSYEDRDELQRLLVGLSEPEREVVVLRGLYQMSFVEMAKELGEAESAIKARFYRACDRLRETRTTGEG